MVMQKTTLDELRAHSASGPLRVLAAVEPQTYFCEAYAKENTIYIKNGGANYSTSYVYGARLHS